MWPVSFLAIHGNKTPDFEPFLQVADYNNKSVPSFENPSLRHTGRKNADKEIKKTIAGASRGQDQHFPGHFPLSDCNHRPFRFGGHAHADNISIIAPSSLYISPLSFRSEQRNFDQACISYYSYVSDLPSVPYH